jgi:hypothetical protein
VYDFVDRVTASKTTTIEHRIQWTNVNPSITVQEDRLSAPLTGTPIAAISSQQIPGNTDGWVEFTVSSSTHVGVVRWFGLSSGTPPNTGSSIGYGVQQSRTSTSWTVQAQEGSTLVGNSLNVDAGDVIRIERKG